MHVSGSRCLLAVRWRAGTKVPRRQDVEVLTDFFVASCRSKRCVTIMTWLTRDLFVARSDHGPPPWVPPTSSASLGDGCGGGGAPTAPPTYFYTDRLPHSSHLLIWSSPPSKTASLRCPHRFASSTLDPNPLTSRVKPPGNTIIHEGCYSNLRQEEENDSRTRWQL
jgi:hypothetical protein